MVEDMGSILQKVGFFFCHWQSHKQYILSFPVFVLPRWKWNWCKTQLDNMHYGIFFECSFVKYCPSNLFSGSPSPLPLLKVKVHYIQTVCDWKGGGGCWVVSETIFCLQEFNTLFLTRFRNYKIAAQPQTKATRRGILKQISTCRKAPLPVIFFR